MSWWNKSVGRQARRGTFGGMANYLRRRQRRNRNVSGLYQDYGGAGGSLLSSFRRGQAEGRLLKSLFGLTGKKKHAQLKLGGLQGQTRQSIGLQAKIAQLFGPAKGQGPSRKARSGKTQLGKVKSLRGLATLTGRQAQTPKGRGKRGTSLKQSSSGGKRRPRGIPRWASAGTNPPPGSRYGPVQATQVNLGMAGPPGLPAITTLSPAPGARSAPALGPRDPTLLRPTGAATGLGGKRKTRLPSGSTRLASGMTRIGGKQKTQLSPPGSGDTQIRSGKKTQADYEQAIFMGTKIRSSEGAFEMAPRPPIPGKEALPSSAKGYAKARTQGDEMDYERSQMLQIMEKILKEIEKATRGKDDAARALERTFLTRGQGR